MCYTEIGKASVECRVGSNADEHNIHGTAIANYPQRRGPKPSGVCFFRRRNDERGKVH